MTLLPRPPLRSRSARIRLRLPVALACICGLAALSGVAQADVALFAPTFTVGQPVSRADFPYQSFVPGHLSAVPDPDGSGAAVLNYTVDNADQPYPGAHPRADLLTRPWYTEGSTLFTSIPVKIPAGLTPFQNSGSSYYQFAEAKDTAASSPSWGLGLMADSSGRDHYFFGSTPEIGTSGDLWLGPVVDGGWHTFVVAAYYTASARKGWVELYVDGQPITFNMGKFSGQTRAMGITIGSTLASVIGTPKPGAPPAPSPVAPPAPPPLSVVASPRPLKAAFTTSPRTSAVGQRVAFDATTSTGTPVRYVWSDRRHVLGTGPKLSYTFRSAGTKRIRLTITDGNGKKSTVRHEHLVLRKLHRRAHHGRGHHHHHHRSHHRSKRRHRHRAGG
jgi:hypothetical protein